MRVAIVTGASSGNGRAIAVRLAEDGFAVVCSDLREQARGDGYETDLETPTHRVIERSGGSSRFFRADVSRLADVQALGDHAVSEFGRLDVMVNNAGIATPTATVVDEAEEDFDLTIAVNLKGVWNGCKASIGRFMQQEVENGCRGKVVNIASIGGLVGLPEEPAYSAAKGGVVNLTRQIASDFAKHRVRVNAICPGYLATGMIREMLEDPVWNERLHEHSPWPELGGPGDVAKAVSYLAGDESAWVTGSMLTVDGGYTAR